MENQEYELIEKAIGGNNDALEKLIIGIQDMVYIICLYVCSETFAMQKTQFRRLL